MLKNALAVLLMLVFVGMSAIATVIALQAFCDVALLQVEHDLLLSSSQL